MNNKFNITASASIIASLSFLLFLPHTEAFASKTGGWKNRPVAPELAKSEDKGGERVPWDGIRFLKQSSKFITMPSPFSKSGKAKEILPGDTLWEPGANKIIPSWGPLDDVVMGGASESSFDDATGIWRGIVTSANNGGFVGIRTTPFAVPLDMKNCGGLELRIKGGRGKRFKAVVRDSTDFNGVCWTTSFDVPSLSLGNVSTIRLPFEKQIPTIFARTVPDQKFNEENVVGLQLAYSMFEYDGNLNPNFSLGGFDLQLMGIRAY